MDMYSPPRGLTLQSPLLIVELLAVALGTQAIVLGSPVESAAHPALQILLPQAQGRRSRRRRHLGCSVME